ATAKLAQAYEQSLLYGEHTWGGALSWVLRYSQHTPFPYGEAWQQQRAQGRFERLEASWAEHSAYIAKAAALVTPLLTSEMQGLARQVHADGPRIVVYNPLPWKRDGLVSLNAAGQSVSALRPLDGKRIVPVAYEGDTLQFLAQAVPPMGYRTFEPVAPPQARSGLQYDATLATLENEFFKATLDPPRGAIRSLIDKRTGRELVDPSAAHGFGQYLYERFDADQVAAYVKAYVKITADWAVTELGKPNLPPAKEVPYRAVSPRQCQVRFEQSPVAVAAVLQAPATAELPCAVTTRFSLAASQPYLEVEVTLHDKPADPWPEAGWICLPVQVPNPQFDWAAWVQS
ncbi:MAG TPA: hypothetical protein VNT26_01295, partial [Candidatus Sulfotelmatobacter sp.]|nr:hypothetical protein [Candidatus Sulfotelmatobacter sp.]